MSSKIILLPGDGIGPEVIAPALEVLAAAGADLEYEEHLFGGASIDAHGVALTDETLAACQAADAVLLAAVGGPKWDTTDPTKPRPEQGLLGLRKGLGLYANLRPVRPLPALYDASPLKREVIEGTDLLVVRELTGGIYFGEKTRTPTAPATCACTRVGGDRADRACRLRRRAPQGHERRQGERARDLQILARGRHRASTPRSSPTSSSSTCSSTTPRWRSSAQPSRFDVIVTENMFGDILSDEAAMITGSIGMLPERLARRAGRPGLFEPVHGSAPDIAGTGAANPLAMFLSVALMLRHGLGLEAQAAR